ncbi:carbohydrate sulfotransferase 6-like [Cherax quadricarinatus]|uniref:carbohydrate sulfotransferase 6-like n=1 Tax=Cherax quadricarinatus TaxID=27406 RepID=UPI00237831FF|nr:carbohydrate sulfotransferase 6-like [Cherax quadricarinatus]
MVNVFAYNVSVRWWQRRALLLMLVALVGLLTVLQTLTAPQLPHKPKQIMFSRERPSHLRPNIILWTMMRSGSSLTEEMLSSLPCSFVTEEPLREYKNFNDTFARDFLRDILHCRFSKYPYYFERWMFGNQLNDLKMKLLCYQYASMCYDATWTESMCKGACMMILRVVAGQLKLTTSLLQDSTLRNYVVHLVRDPRALLASRYSLEKHTEMLLENATFFTHQEKNPADVCRRYRQDLSSARFLHRHYPHRYTLIRYEDVALDPSRYVRSIYNFTELPYTKVVAHNVATLTLGMYDDTFQSHPYSTNKNSTEVVYRWRTSLPYSEMEKIQAECHDVLQAYGYPVFASKTEYESQLTKILPLKAVTWQVNTTDT